MCHAAQKLVQLMMLFLQDKILSGGEQGGAHRVHGSNNLKGWCHTGGQEGGLHGDTPDGTLEAGVVVVCQCVPWHMSLLIDCIVFDVTEKIRKRSAIVI